jgi:alpha-1,2-mannosyltransferase
VENHRVTRSAAGWRALGGAVLLLAAAPLAWRYLVAYPPENWQVDLEVYREGARALVTGVPLYDLRTDAPQFLPFTYPPFAAFAALPLLVAPFHVIGWLWTLAQLALLWWTVGVAFRPFLDRFGPRAGLVQGLLAAGGAWLLPVSEGIRYGQVNAVVVALCLWDVTRRSRRGPDGGPGAWAGGSGVGVGLATAVKLTPGVFWLHWAAARRWRVLAVSVGTAVGVTVATALVLPAASAAYWSDALLDPERLGPNAGTSNQSLRGLLLRIGPGEGLLGSAVWIALAAAVVVAGLALSRRLDRLGEPVAVVAAVGLVAYLVSPVSWVHHLHWGVVVAGALLGDGRVRGRVVAAAVAATLLWLRLPWWGATLLATGDVPRWLARVVQSSYTELALLGLVALWWFVARRPAPEATEATEAPAPPAAGADQADQTDQPTSRALRA